MPSRLSPTSKASPGLSISALAFIYPVWIPLGKLDQTEGLTRQRIFAIAQRDGLDVHLAFIPAGIQNTSQEPFAPVYMKSLFDLGYDLTKNGYPWEQDILYIDSEKSHQQRQ